MKKKVIIDCDPGADDAIALFLAVESEELDILGITVSYGNSDVLQCYKNVYRILNLCHRLDIPVFIGESNPLNRDIELSNDYCGLDGMCNSSIPYFSKIDESKSALSFILHAIKNVENLWIISIAGMTNIAKVILLSEESDISQLTIVSIAGYYGIRKEDDNFTPRPEWNYSVDPDAYKIVLESNIKVILLGLDVTSKLNSLIICSNQINNKYTKFINECAIFNESRKLEVYSLFVDSLAIAYLIDDNIASFIRGNILVENPETINSNSIKFIQDVSGRKFVATNIDLHLFDKILKQRIWLK